MLSVLPTISVPTMLAVFIAIAPMLAMRPVLAMLLDLLSVSFCDAASSRQPAPACYASVLQVGFVVILPLRAALSVFAIRQRSSYCCTRRCCGCNTTIRACFPEVLAILLWLLTAIVLASLLDVFPIILLPVQVQCYCSMLSVTAMLPVLSIRRHRQGRY